MRVADGIGAPMQMMTAAPTGMIVFAKEMAAAGAFAWCKAVQIAQPSDSSEDEAPGEVV
jgi:hypothetical protein